MYVTLNTMYGVLFYSLKMVYLDQSTLEMASKTPIYSRVVLLEIIGLQLYRQFVYTCNPFVRDE